MMDSVGLPDHPAFLRLSPAQWNRLVSLSETWRAPAGSAVYHPGDSGEDVLLILEGRLESGPAEAKRRWLPGDLWGEDRLAHPRPVDHSLIAAEDSRWLRWPFARLLDALAGDAGLRRALRPVIDQNGHPVSGLPGLPSSTKAGSAGAPAALRTLRPSLRPVLAGIIPAGAAAMGLRLIAEVSEGLPALLPLAAPAAYLGVLFAALVGRWMTEYSVGSDALSSRTFVWNRLSAESRRAPLDEVQGVEVEKSGLLRRILGIGSVIVKTSARDGEIVFRRIDGPEALGDEIRGLLDARSRRSRGRDRESMRRALEAGGVSEYSPRMVRPAAAAGRPAGAGELRFRKSPVVLTGRLLLPAAAAAALLVAAGFLPSDFPVSPAGVRLAVWPMVLWALHRLEDWRNDRYGVSGSYAVDLYRKPLGIKESRREVDLASVQNIRTEQNGLPAVLFGYGDVVLVSAGGASDAVFKNVSRPWRVQDALFRAREEELRRRAERERDLRKADMVRMAEALDQIRRERPESADAQTPA